MRTLRFDRSRFRYERLDVMTFLASLNRRVFDMVEIGAVTGLALNTAGHVPIGTERLGCRRRCKRSARDGEDEESDVRCRIFILTLLKKTADRAGGFFLT